MSHTVLVIDGGGGSGQQLARRLAERDYSVECVTYGAQADKRLSASRAPLVAVLDEPPLLGGCFDILEQLGNRTKPIPSIVLSAVAQAATIVKAMRLGAVDYLIKPVDEGDLEQAIRSALAHQESSNPQAASAKPAAAGSDASHVEIPWCASVTHNPTLQKLLRIAKRVAPTNVPVLISGESGVGKGVLAEFIHADSRRRDHPLVKVNSAAIPQELMESELFGHERGAFTGALIRRPGKFELADGGTILLDEIGELSPALQAKLLHVLQDGEFTRLGGTTPIHSDARVLAATNKRLDRAVARGEFREDLYYRLNVVTIEIPPLRQRPEDITPLCRQFVAQCSAEYGETGVEISDRLMGAFLSFHWPGNVRQLENTIKRYVILRDEESILAALAKEDEPELVVMAAAAGGGTSIARADPGRRSLKGVAAAAAERAEKELVLRLLEERHWNRKQVAAELNICYKSLLNKLQRWGIPGRSGGGARCA